MYYIALVMYKKRHLVIILKNKFHGVKWLMR